jgi:hypothetical protein
MYDMKALKGAAPSVNKAEAGRRHTSNSRERRMKLHLRKAEFTINKG